MLSPMSSTPWPRVSSPRTPRPKRRWRGAAGPADLPQRARCPVQVWVPGSFGARRRTRLSSFRILRPAGPRTAGGQEKPSALLGPGRERLRLPGGCRVSIWRIGGAVAGPVAFGCRLCTARRPQPPRPANAPHTDRPPTERYPDGNDPRCSPSGAVGCPDGPSEVRIR